MCVVCACSIEGERERERAKNGVVHVGGATWTPLEGRAVGRVGVDEERCVHDSYEHRRTGDCFEHDWKERKQA